MPLCRLPPLLDFRNLPDPRQVEPVRPVLSIITATTPDRVQWATNTMETIRHQRCQRPHQPTEHLLICDGHSPVLRGRCQDNECRYIRLSAGPHHDYGASAHQRGIEHAIGEWVCFWDDDNVYFSHALEAVLDAIRFPGDIHVLQTRHYGDGQRCRVIPPASWRPPEFMHAGIDTMCLVVKREFALRESWIDSHLGERGSDFRWLQRLSRHNPQVQFWPIEIGAHS